MELKIKSRKYGEVIFIVDDQFKDLLASYKWCVSKESKGNSQLLMYAVGFKPPRKRGMALTRLHRLVTNAEPAQMVDHINRNTLDNRLNNLRFVTHAENMKNMRKRVKSIYTGVSKSKDKWRARLFIDGKEKWLGLHRTPELAAQAIEKFKQNS